MILVTGGSGYFGSLLVRTLVRAEYRVRVFDLNDADDRPTGVEFHQGDIRNVAALRKACDGVAVVFHNVAEGPLAKDRDAIWSVNRDGTRTLLAAAAEAKVRKVVYTSTSAVFGIPDRTPITADTLPRPVEEYGAAKLEGERICREYVDRGLDITIIRPTAIMGHGRMGIMQLIFEWVAQGRNVYVLGSGDNRFQFVHADDLAAACMKAAERSGFAIYNIGAEKFGTMRETLGDLVRHAGTGSKVRSLPYGPAVAAMKLTSRLGLSPLAPFHWLLYGREMFFDLSKPKSELLWQPKFGNSEMFIQSYEWYLANRDRVLAARGRSWQQSALNEGILRLLRWV